MSNLPRRAVLVGMDGAIPQWCDRMVKEGRLPHLARLIRDGTFFYGLNPYPTVTASSWTTLATGAWPGRHKVTHYNVHHPGWPLHQTISGFDTRECAAEHIWTAAEKAGKRSILIKYETSWPPNLKNGLVVDGCGPNYYDDFRRIMFGFCLTTSPQPGTTVVKLKPAPQMAGKLSGDFVLTTDQKEEKRYSLTIEPSAGKRSAVLSSARGELGRVLEGEWSPVISDQFQLDGKSVEAYFRLRAIRLPADEKGELQLVSTAIFPKTGWTHPDSLGLELLEKVGPYLPRPLWEARVRQWIGDDDYLQSLEMQHEWLGKAAQYLLGKEAWDLCYLQTHAQDYGHHLWLRAADPPAPGVIPPEAHRNAKRCLDYTYESADRMLGLVLDAVDEDTLVIVVADHGAVTWNHHLAVDHILQHKGLQVVEKDPATGASRIDWSKTKAVSQRGSYIYVNLKGRDPDGIVEPGEEYEQVRNQIIQALYDFEDKENGVRPFSIVLRREDARLIGLYGDRVGDIVFAMREGYGHEHGSQLPTGRLCNSSLEALLVLAGPGIKRGHKDTEPMANIVDVVPTICYLLDIPFPIGCQGALLYDAFADPGLKVTEKRNLESDCRKWQDACEKLSHITHTPEP
jgi:predicted AlkP superfamily phosphohydrolase/phosphomutase